MRRSPLVAWLWVAFWGVVVLASLGALTDRIGPPVAVIFMMLWSALGAVVLAWARHRSEGYIIVVGVLALFFGPITFLHQWLLGYLSEQRRP